MSDRVELFRHAKAVLRGIGQGESVTLDLPQDQPQRRMDYLTINSAASAVWGPHEYRLRILRDPFRVLVTRTLGRKVVAKAAAARRRAVDGRSGAKA